MLDLRPQLIPLVQLFQLRLGAFTLDLTCLVLVLDHLLGVDLNTLEIATALHESGLELFTSCNEHLRACSVGTLSYGTYNLVTEVTEVINQVMEVTLERKT